MQSKQLAWYSQWTRFEDNELFLFEEWIAPATLEDFKDKEVLECGCGLGQHTSFMAPHAKEVVAVDLNTVDIAKKRNRTFANVSFIDADIAHMDLKRQFDVVISIGVIHHTDQPDKTILNLKRHLKPGGKLIVWVYSEEGNFLVKNFVEPFRKLFLSDVNPALLTMISRILCVAMYPPIYTVYLLPLNGLPYFQYFQNFRKLSFERNVLNVFDKLNAPQVDLINRERIGKWFSPEEFNDVSICSYKGVSWSGVGTKKLTHSESN